MVKKFNFNGEESATAINASFKWAGAAGCMTEFAYHMTALFYFGHRAAPGINYCAFVHS